VKDSAFRYVTGNDALWRLYPEAREGLGKTDFELFSRDRAEAIRADDMRVMQEGHSLSEQAAIAPDGTAERYQVKKVRVAGVDGHYIIVGLLREIATAPFKEKIAVPPRRLFSDSRMLVVENNPIHQHMAREILGGLNIKVDVVAGYDLAREKIKSTRYAALLLECGVESKNNLQLAAEILAAEKQSNTLRPVIIGILPSESGIAPAGLDATVHKPLLSAALEKILRQFFG
jgi:CheY-like chemotaxis protein